MAAIFLCVHVCVDLIIFNQKKKIKIYKFSGAA